MWKGREAMIDYAKIDTSHDDDMDTQKLLTGLFMMIGFVVFLLSWDML